MKIILIISLILFGVLASGCLSTTPPPPPGEFQQGVQSNEQTGSYPPGIPNESIPNLTGRWTGLTTGHIQGSGFYSHHNAVFNITGQQRYAFEGNKEYIRPDVKTYYENFSGAFSPDGEMLFADSTKGYSIGRITGPDSMYLLTGQDGNASRAFIQFLTRQS